MSSDQHAPVAAFLIRDARSLDVYEKAFLFVVASRREMFTSAAVAADDMGMSRAKFHRVRDSLLTRGLIDADQRTNRPSTYRVNLKQLGELVPRKDEPVRTLRKVSPMETPRKVSTTETPTRKASPTETPRRLRKVSPVETVVSPTETHKKKEKKNKRKKNKKGSPAETPSGNNRETILKLVRNSERGMFTNEIATSLGKPSIELIDELRQMKSLGMIMNISAKGNLERWKEAS